MPYETRQRRPGMVAEGAEPAPEMPLPPMPAPPDHNPLAMVGASGARSTSAPRPPGMGMGPTGPGTPIFGGMTGFGGGFEQMLGDDEVLRRIVAGLPLGR